MGVETFKSVFQLNQICAVIDTSGFKLEYNGINIYLPRELSVFGEKGNIHQTYNTSVDMKNIPERSRTLMQNQTSHFHGIQLTTEEEADELALVKFRDDLNSMYRIFATDDKPFFAIQNFNLAKLLNELNCRFIYFHAFSVPFKYQLNEKYNDVLLCKLHKLNNLSVMDWNCSYRNAKSFYRWIIENTIVKGYTPIF